MQRRNQTKMLGGAQPRTDPDCLLGGANSRAKPESRRRSARDWGRSPNEGEAREEAGGLGRGLSELLPRKFLKIITLNHAIWCIADAKIKSYEQNTFPGLKNIFMQELIFYMTWALVEYKFVHTHSSCNHCVSNITRRCRIFFDVWRCTVYLAAVHGNITVCKHYQKISPR